MRVQDIIKSLTDEDIQQDITLEIYSAYGGVCLGQVKVSGVMELVESEERQVNRDYFITKC